MLDYFLLGVTGGDSIAWYMGRKMGLEPTGFVRRLLGKKSIEDMFLSLKNMEFGPLLSLVKSQGIAFRLSFFREPQAYRFGKFFLIDGASSMITVNLYFSLGFYFGDRLPIIREFIENNIATVSKFGLFTVFVVGFWILRGRRMLRSKE